MRRRWPIGQLALVLLLGSSVEATASMPGAYTDATAFAAAAPGPTATVDFESTTPGVPVSSVTLTPAGSSTGIVLPAPLADLLDTGGPNLELQVVEDAGDNPAASGVRTLGVDDGGNFDAITGGAPLAFTFTQPVEAFGLTLITPEEPALALFDGDAQLDVSGEPTAALSLADGQVLGTFGGREYRAYFVGIVGASAFSSATLSYAASTPDSSFFFNVDDLAIAVPEPEPLLTLALGFALAQALARRRNRTPRASHHAADAATSHALRRP